MAQRPRQTRLQFESAFRPTSVDTMAADAMRQLAGLGRQMRQTTEEIGRPIVEQEMAEKGAKAAQEAADRLIKAGVKGILNFSPLKIKVPKNIMYRDMDFTNALRFIAASMSD